MMRATKVCRLCGETIVCWILREWLDIWKNKPCGDCVAESKRSAG